jgi:glycosyltransferase involved in cell wall biosynthesis
MLSIIIPTKDRKNILNQTLKCLERALIDVESEIIIVNDGSDTINRNYGNDIKVISNPGYGAASGRNAGASCAKGDLLLFLDDDILVNKGHIKRTIKLHKNHKNTIFNFSWQYPDKVIDQLHSTLHGRFILKTKRSSNSYRIPDVVIRKGLQPMTGLSSQYFSIERVIFENVGGYDSRIPLAGVEDIVLAHGLLAMGITIILSFDDVVIHNELDRINRVAMTKRFQSGAKTARIANDLGYDFIDIGMQGTKKHLLSIVQLTTPIWIFFIQLLPNLKIADPLYAFIMRILLSSATYKGYFKA